MKIGISPLKYVSFSKVIRDRLIDVKDIKLFDQVNFYFLTHFTP